MPIFPPQAADAYGVSREILGARREANCCGFRRFVAVMRNEPLRLLQPEELCSFTDAQTIADRVQRLYTSIGKAIDDDSDAALLADALCVDCPIVGVSQGFVDLTGFPRERLLGQNCRILLDGVPEVAVSRSARKNLRDFCRMCRLQGLENISEATSIQPNTCVDGTQFINFFMVGLCMVARHPYILGIQRRVGDGLFVRLSNDETKQVTEKLRASLLRLRHQLQSLVVDPVTDLHMPVCKDKLGENSSYNKPEFRFYPERLQDHCLLMNSGCTAIRREPQELATNCLVFGDRPIKHTEHGLYFSVRVDDVVTTFEGLPVLGFTRRKPEDGPTLYPTVTKCMGKSVLVGACAEAFARDQHEHFKIGFKLPPKTEVQCWAREENVPLHRRKKGFVVNPGDKLGCVYTLDGHIQLFFNGIKALDFDVERPVDSTADYYAVVDACFSAYSLTLLPPAAALSGELQPQSARLHADGLEVEGVTCACDSQQRVARQPTCEDIDGRVSMVVNEAIVKKAIKSVVADCDFCVTIADPQSKDVHLIAVSEAFEAMTGYCRREILGVNCRFLNQSCPISPVDVMALRLASESGAPYTALLPNRKKSGEMFINLLDLRGLTVAQDTETGKALWYLIGIQADVTGMATDGIPEDHFSALQEVAWKIREGLKRELSTLAQSSAESFESETPLNSPSSDRSISLDSAGLPSNFRILQEPIWMIGDSASGDTKLSATMPPGAAMTQTPLAASPPSGTEASGEQHNAHSFQKFEEAYARKARASPPHPRVQASFVQRSSNSQSDGFAPVASLIAAACCAFALGWLIGRGRW